VSEAPAFYAVIAGSVLIGLGAQYLPIPPLKALFWSAVVNGVVAVPLMVVILLLAARKTVMGAFVASRGMLCLGWLATAIMATAAGVMLATLLG
jgi:Mn2+/Fe2+ NRAMP family transporter